MDNEVSFAEYLKKSKWQDLVSLVNDIDISTFRDLTTKNINEINYKIDYCKFSVAAIDNIFKRIVQYEKNFKYLGQFFDLFNDSIIDLLIDAAENKDFIDSASLNSIKDKISHKILPLIFEFNIFTKEAYENELAILQGRTPNTAEELKLRAEEIDEVLRQAHKSLENIKELERQLLSGQGENGLIKTKIEDIYSTLQSKRNAIVNFHDTLINDDKDTPSLSYQIRSARDQAVENNKKSEQQYNEINKIKSDILEFNDKIFGSKDSEGNLTIGLDEYIENGRKNLDDITNAHKTKFEILEEEIEGLLPRATNIALSKAFETMQLSFQKPIKTYSRLFYLAMAGILVFGGYVMYMNIGLTSTDASQFVNSLFLKLPILIALVWFAIFASKRRSEYIRLQQEYAHKEVLAKTYEGFKKQIIDLGRENDPLMDELIANAIKAISFNPSTTLDGKHGDKPPFIGAFEKLITKAEKLLPESKLGKDK